MAGVLQTERHGDFRGFSLFLTISAIAHLTLLAVIAASPHRSQSKFLYPGAIHVDLVAGGFPAGGGSASTPYSYTASPDRTPASTAVPSPPAPAPRDDLTFRKETAASAPKSIPTKTSLKRRTFKPAEATRSAVAGMEQRVSEDPPQVLSSAIDRIRRQVAEGSPDGRAGWGSGGSGTSGASRIDIYRAEINFYIKQNWNFAEHLAGDAREFRVSYWIRIQKNGEISNITMEKSSGNRYLDESAHRAIMRSNPLPPLPEGYPYSYYEVPLNFDPSELHRPR